VIRKFYSRWYISLSVLFQLNRSYVALGPDSKIFICANDVRHLEIVNNSRWYFFGI